MDPEWGARTRGKVFKLRQEACLYEQQIFFRLEFGRGVVLEPRSSEVISYTLVFRNYHYGEH